MNYWLVKTEPGTYSWDNLKGDKKTVWDGVRNYQARNFLKDMKKGDLVFVYHSVNEKSIIGIATVTKEAFPDPSDIDWIAVEITVKEALPRPISLAEIKANKKLKEMKLIKNSRLSVQPVLKSEYDIIMQMSLKK